MSDKAVSILHDEDASDDEKERYEDGYTDGRLSAFQWLLNEAFRKIGVDDPLGHAAGLAQEHGDLARELKELWEEVFDSRPFPKDLYLPDVVRTIAKEVGGWSE